MIWISGPILRRIIVEVLDWRKRYKRRKRLNPIQLMTEECKGQDHSERLEHTGQLTLSELLFLNGRVIMY